MVLQLKTSNTKCPARHFQIRRLILSRIPFRFLLLSRCGVDGRSEKTTAYTANKQPWSRQQISHSSLNRKVYGSCCDTCPIANSCLVWRGWHRRQALLLYLPASASSEFVLCWAKTVVMRIFFWSQHNVRPDVVVLSLAGFGLGIARTSHLDPRKGLRRPGRWLSFFRILRLLLKLSSYSCPLPLRWCW